MSWNKKKYKMQLENKKYGWLIWWIEEIISKSKNKVVSSVNSILVELNWNIWKYIVEFEQWWKDRAEYWKWLLKNISKDLTEKFWRWYSVQNLERMRNFYSFLPEINFTKSSSLMRILSWTHISRILNISNLEERSFYMIESANEKWSVRELDRQINSCLYERLALSKDKKWIKELSEKWQIIENPIDSLKDPYILEFLWFDEKNKYSESDLESAIIDNLEKFLLELWKWFTFVWRQVRISNWSDHYYIDLVFYNRLLKSFVLIDLKIWKLKHQDIGQMQMYVNFYDKEIKEESENKTIGILLCKENDEFVVKYTIPEDSNVFSKEYKLYLPDKKILQDELNKFLK